MVTSIAAAHAESRGGRSLAGARVLLVEDNAIIALGMASLLEDEGAHIVGPFAHLSTAMDEIAERLPDVALLDIELADGVVFPLADALCEAGVPMVFHSGGAGRHSLVRTYPDAPLCEKPSSERVVIGALTGVLARS